jgi:hypothetical protein
MQASGTMPVMRGDSAAALQAWAAIDSIISLALGVFCLTSSIGALRLRPWARKAWRTYAALYLVWLGLCLLINLAWKLPALMDQALGGRAGANADAARIGAYIGVIVVLGIAAIYPIVLLAYTKKPEIRSAFGETVPGMTVGYAAPAYATPAYDVTGYFAHLPAGPEELEILAPVEEITPPADPCTAGREPPA